MFFIFLRGLVKHEKGARRKTKWVKGVLVRAFVNQERVRQPIASKFVTPRQSGLELVPREKAPALQAV
ncbi:hypothetical protein GCM10007895_08120 [Paraferrimonas sedimenticola]|uniref:Uncharacterized protein n=1 Tax=Paraferrimonas sedimenticola TaxID=375674 RepID=A0AA37RTR9_9GAMM|nr:hypothetical protein GCM10007895_08120 [Paraferrimonas sedimenticola]